MRVARFFMIALVSIVALLAGQQPARAEGDATRGKAAFRKTCAVCHGDATAAAGPGPSLAGLVGRRAGTVNGTPYGRNL